MAGSLNKVFLAGNLTREIELKYTSGGKAYVNFSLGINESFKQGDEWKKRTIYPNVVVWGKMAENCAEYLKKGSSVLIEGKLQMDQWEKDGQKHYSTKIAAQSVQFLDGKGR